MRKKDRTRSVGRVYPRVRNQVPATHPTRPTWLQHAHAMRSAWVAPCSPRTPEGGTIHPCSQNRGCGNNYRQLPPVRTPRGTRAPVIARESPPADVFRRELHKPPTAPPAFRLPQNTSAYASTPLWCPLMDLRPNSIPAPKNTA